MTKIKELSNVPWIILLTHGKAGEELIKSAEMILGDFKNVYSFSLLPSMSPDDYAKEIKKVLDQVPKGTLVLTDLFGGTPSNVAIALSKDYDISVVSGLNIAMLIEADSARERLRGIELAKKVVNMGRESCKVITNLLAK